jgi:hypothetical protein
LIELSDQFDLITRIGTSNEFLHKQFKSKDVSINKLKCLDYEHFTTIIKVKNLFGKHILRQNQLKQNSMKILKHLLKMIEALSIIHYNIDIIVVDFNSILLQTFKRNSLKDKFISLFSSNNQKLIKDFLFKDESYEIYGLIGEITKTNEIFSSFNFQSAKLQFIYVNERHIENKNMYEYVAKQLSKCHPLNLFKSDFKNIIYCLSIKCKHSNGFTFTRINQTTLIDFKNETIYQSLENFINQFLINYGFKKINETIEPEVKKIYAFELNKNIKSSKIIKNTFYQNENKKSDLNLRKHLVRLKGEPKAKKTEQLGIVPDLNRKKILLNELKSKFHKKNKNKSTQTESNTNIKLKPNWTRLKNSLGIDFYFNEIYGTTTYDANLVKMDANYFDYDNIEKNEYFKNDYNNSVKLKDFDLNKVLIEKLIVVKWRNRDEYINQQKLLNYNSFENFNSIGNLKLDHSLFEKIKVYNTVKLLNSKRRLNFFIIFVFFFVERSSKF